MGGTVCAAADLSKRLRLLMACALSLFCFVSARAADVDATLSPNTARVGDTLRYEIRVTGATGRTIHFAPPSGETVAVVRADSSRRAQGVMTYTVAAYDTGRHELGNLPVVVGDGAVAETLYTPSSAVLIRSIVPDSAQAIQPIKPYREHPFQLRELLAWIWIPIALVVLGAAWWVWRRFIRKRAAGEESPAIPLPPADREAVQNLIALKEKKYPARGMLKEFFTEYSYIMRRYLERRYEFPALEMTTFDISREIEERALPDILETRLLPALRESDLVKFAKFVPDFNRCDPLLELGFEIVEVTRLREEEEPQEKAA